ncbi:hypothetical protein ACROYT_G017298 [Oculina patagonica]
MTCVNKLYWCRLTDDQKEIYQVVQSGHNVFITGKAGTGKSFLVKELFRNFVRRGVSCAIISSSGISGTLYNELGVAVPTVHAYYALETANRPWRQVVERSAANNLVREKLSSVECIIWDEASMSSRRVFEITNYIHHLLAPCNDTWKPFAGKQVVVVGEFLQLQPVPNFFDEGRPMFESHIFCKALSHRYELSTIMRQDPKELQFLQCLGEVRLGYCSGTSQRFLEYLSITLTDEFVRLTATDDGDTRGIQCPAEKVIILKPGCKVMLLWNVSDKLRNGSSGIFVESKEGNIIVDFPDVGHTCLQRQTWYKRLLTGIAVGSRRQYPVAPMYAITCHKSQGLTLQAAVVHCSREFVPGLTYVSFSRVETCENLQVIGFSKEQLLKPGEAFLRVCEGHRDPVNGHEFSCCRNQLLSEEEMIVVESDYNAEVENDARLRFNGDALWNESEQLVSSFFERGEPEEQVVDLNTVYALLTEEGQNSILRNTPADFDLRHILEEIKVKEVLSDFSKRVNEEVEKLITLDQENRKVMGQILWYRAVQIIIVIQMWN